MECKNSWKIATFILLGVMIGYGVSQIPFASILSSSDTPTKTVTVTPAEKPVTPEYIDLITLDITDEEGLGNPAAPVTVLEYSDLQCFFCRRAYNETFDLLKADYIDTGKVYFVYRHFPLSQIHPDALNAAMATECAREQGAYWDMMDLIVEGQNELDPGAEKTVSIPPESIQKYAVDLGLDATSFNTCLEANRYAAGIEDQLQGGVNAGVLYTPTFIVNGKTLVGAQPYANLSAAIDAALTN
ncbi:MAG: DsbA family protein [Candidatus Gracilibacteria bacterium]